MEGNVAAAVREGHISAALQQLLYDVHAIEADRNAQGGDAPRVLGICICSAL